MTEQRKKILESVKFVKNEYPVKFKPTIALITEENFRIPNYIKIIKKIELQKIPPYIFVDNGIGESHLLFAKFQEKDIILLQGRYHFYEGFSMRELGHFIYMLNTLGIKKIISIDEVAALNPRFDLGDLCIIYDHINLMGDNPLIGINDNELGIRFPDMSEPYDAGIYKTVYKLFQEHKFRMNESVYLGIIGPESETESEARFYRSIGADVLGYSIIPENITAVHCNTKFFGLGLITRELIADKMLEDNTTEIEKVKQRYKYLQMALKKSELILKSILKERSI